MKSNVNPFEPWRPAEAAVPRPLHAARPWRPPPPPPVAPAVEEPPLVEPVNPPPPKKAMEPPPRRNPPRSGNESSSPRHPPVLLCVAIALTAGITSLNNGAQAPFFALGACAIVLVVMAFDPRRTWYKRLSWMTAAFTLAGMAAWFVPTSHGINLWSAYRQIEALRVLPAGDVAGYQRDAEARRILVKDFPSFAADVTAAEQAWLRRTVDEAVEKADRQLAVDPHAALGDLHRLNAELTPLEHYASVKKELDAARHRALQACLKIAAE